MKYTVTIKDNESGEIIREVESNAIVAGVSLENNESAAIVLTSCSLAEVIAVYHATEKAIEAFVKKNPILLIADMLGEAEEKEDTDND